MLLKQEKTAKLGLKAKIMKAACDKEYLLKVLNFNAIAQRFGTSLLTVYFSEI